MIVCRDKKTDAEEMETARGKQRQQQLLVEREVGMETRGDRGRNGDRGEIKR